jgi:mono/diheme cytochrome c family protein
MAIWSGNQKYSHLRTTQIAGKKLYFQKNCQECHTLGTEKEGKLTPVTDKRNDEWFKEHVVKESPVVLRQTTSERKKRRIINAEILALDDYLYKTSAEQKSEIDRMSENIFTGAFAVYQHNCLRCHTIAGAGRENGPELTYVADKHGDREWLTKNLLNPEQFSPETTMPKFDHLDKEVIDHIVDYLLTLKK